MQEQKFGRAGRWAPHKSAPDALEDEPPHGLDDGDATNRERMDRTMTEPGQTPSTLPRAAFVAAYGGVYEHSAWVAETVADDGLTAADDDPAELSARMAAIVGAAGPERQLALLRLHPELVGKLKVGEALTTESKREQASARLDGCSAEEFERFRMLNEAYNARFGFPFIVAVTGMSRADILAAFATRVGNAPDVEFRTALDNVHRIARIRLDALAGRSRAPGVMA